MLVSAVMAMTLALAVQDPAAPVAAPVTAPSVAPPTQAPAATPAPAAETAAVPEAQMVCRTETLVGTRFPTRICMRQEHRDVRERDSRALAHRLDAINSNRDRIRASGRGAD